MPFVCSLQSIRFEPVLLNDDRITGGVMKAKELRELSIDDLHTEVEKINKEIASIKFKANSESESAPTKLKALKKNIARIYTVINEIKGKSA